MSTRAREYSDVPALAIYEAAQRAIRSLGLDPRSEDRSKLEIIVARTASNDDPEFRLTIFEIGPDSELRVRQQSDGKDAEDQVPHLCEQIFPQCDAEVEKIRQDGRLLGGGSQSEAVPRVSTSPSNADDTEGTDESEARPKSSNWAVRLFLAFAVLWFFTTEAGTNLIDGFMEGFNSGFAERDVAKYNCDDVAALFDGEDLQNAFGGKFEIVSVNDTEQVSKTETEIVCTGEMVLGNNTRQQMRMTVAEEGSSITYSAEPI